MACCGAATRVETARINGKVISLSEDLDDFQGPVKDRVCRDVVFLILFVAFCIGGIVYLAIAWKKGDPERLVHGYDFYGNVCGKKNGKLFNLTLSGQDMTAKPFLSIAGGFSIKRKCSDKCVKSETQVGFYCIATGGNLNNLTELTLITEALNDFGANVKISWVQILLTCLCGFVLSIIFMLLLRFFATIMIYLTVFLIVVGSIGGTIFLWVWWDKKKKDVKLLKEQAPEWDISKFEEQVTGFLVAAIIATIFTVITLLVLFVMRKRIKLVIQLFQEAGKALAAMPMLMFQPLWTILALIIVVVVWLGGWILIQSSGVAVLTDKGYIEFQMDKVIAHMRWYHVFGLLWVSQFVMGCQDVTVSGAVATWYFKRDKSRLGWPILTSMGNLIKYHTGSVAFGSLIIAIVQMIRLVLKFVEKRLRGWTNPVIMVLLKCCQCCLYLFERFLKFLTRNAYIEISIYGYGFCKAAQSAFSIIMNNALRVAAINFVGDFVLVLAKAAVVVATVFIGIEIVQTNLAVTQVWPGVLLATIFTYFIINCFISIYEMAIDTLFICFCEDCQRNDGVDRPYFMSVGLMEFVENSKKAIQLEKERKKENANKGGGLKDKIRTIMSADQYKAPKTDANSLQTQAFPAYATPLEGDRTGTTPLRAPYPPISEPPSPSQFLNLR